MSTISSTPSGEGYWLFTTLERAFAYGDAHFFGDMRAARLTGPFIASVATPTGLGYCMVASDGAVFSNGYLMVASDGGVFDFVNKARSSRLGPAARSFPALS